MNELMAEILADVDRRTELLFGDKETLPDDELEIVFDFDLPFEEKLSKLHALQRRKLS